MLLQEARPAVDFIGSWNLSLVLPGCDVMSQLMTERKWDIHPQITQEKRTILPSSNEPEGTELVTLSDSSWLRGKCFKDLQHDIKVSQEHKVKLMMTFLRTQKLTSGIQYVNPVQLREVKTKRIASIPKNRQDKCNYLYFFFIILAFLPFCIYIKQSASSFLLINTLHNT